MKRLLILALAVASAAQARAGELGAAANASSRIASGTTASYGGDAGSNAKVRPGMSTALAIDLLGREPDRKVGIGAACGMLEVLSWHDRQTRIVSVDGVVSSVSVQQPTVSQRDRAASTPTMRGSAPR